MPCDEAGQAKRHRAKDIRKCRVHCSTRGKEIAMEKSIKTVTIGVVAVVGLIFGGLPAVIAEGTIALVYILMKNI